MDEQKLNIKKMLIDISIRLVLIVVISYALTILINDKNIVRFIIYPLGFLIGFTIKTNNWYVKKEF
jgi:hypothetical protein